MINSQSDLLTEKIKLAEEAVKTVSDPKLKEEAFKIVLSNLLSNAHTSESGQGVERNTKQKKVRKSTSRTAKPPKPSFTTELKFTADNLNDLKTFLDSYKKSGEELTVFLMACFLKEKIGKETFNEADIKYVYDNALSLRLTNMPAMRVEKISRALSWLVATSRKKMWLEENSAGVYKISPQGMIFINGGLNEFKIKG
jgi:hypothetical protein